jgi:signal transduction histidine kinase
VLEYGRGFAHRLEVFDSVDGQLLSHTQAGLHVPIEQWDLQARHPAFRLEPRVHRDLYVRLTGPTSHELPLRLFDLPVYETHVRRDLVWQSLFFGALLVIVAHNFLFGLATRRRALAYYGGFLVSSAFFWICFLGIRPLLFGTGAPAFFDFAFPASIAASSIFSLAFARLLLGLGTHSPRLDRAFRIYERSLLLVLPIHAIGGYAFSIRAALWMLLPWLVLLVGAGVSEAWAGRRVAMIYLAACGVFLIGVLVGVLHALAIIPAHPITSNALQAGSILQFVLLALALADNLNTLQSAARRNAEIAREASEKARKVSEQARDISDKAAAAIAAELEERRRLQGELQVATEHLVQAEKLTTLGTLMAGIAHDLRNPLNHLVGAAEHLREALQELRAGSGGTAALDRAWRVLGWVEQGTGKMDAISRAMRNQARGVTEREDVNLREVVDEALLLCASRTKLDEVTVEVPEATVRVDPTGVGQLVMNLCSNAADALTELRQQDPSHQGHILLRGLVQDRFVRLEVHDNGAGVPQELRERVLEPFFTTKTRGQGTGLGLAIAQRVVQCHGGTLTVGQSEILGGALFVAEWGTLP